MSELWPAMATSGLSHNKIVDAKKKRQRPEGAAVF